jgi:hypothetical protein
MSNPSDHDLPPELEGVAARLTAERRDPSALELDELKQRARRQASKAGRGGIQLKNRIVTAILTVALIGGGGGAVLAAAGGGGSGSVSSSSAAKSQYCPPKSPGGTSKPKEPPPGNNCGKP